MDEPAAAASGEARRGLRGGGIVLTGSAVSLAIQFASLTILSRLLAPADFGIVAMVGIFVALGSLLRDFGLPMAALQMQTLSAQQATNVFWMNFGVASLVGSALAASTPLLVAIYDEPRLGRIVPVLAFVVLLGGVSAQVQVHLARRSKFGILVISDIVAQVVALCVGVALALFGAGYWSLVILNVVAVSLTLALRWTASGWLPGRFRRGHGSKHMLRVGANYGFAQLLTFLQSNVDTLVIGSRYGASSVGYYNRAYQMLTAPAGRLLDPLTQVVITTLNRVKSQGRSPEEPLLRMQFAIGMLVVWVFATSGGVATELIPILLGDGWGEAVPVFQVLAIGGAIWVFNHVSYWAFIMNEMGRELLHYNLVSKPVAVTAILIGSSYGIVGVAWGYTIAMAISWPLNLLWLSRTGGLRATRFAKNGAVLLFAGAVCAAFAHLASVSVRDQSETLALVAGGLAGTAAMVVIPRLMPQTREIYIGWKDMAKTLVADRMLRTG